MNRTEIARRLQEIALEKIVLTNLDSSLINPKPILKGVNYSSMFSGICEDLHKIGLPFGTRTCGEYAEDGIYLGHVSDKGECNWKIVRDSLDAFVLVKNNNKLTNSNPSL